MASKDDIQSDQSFTDIEGQEKGSIDSSSPNKQNVSSEFTFQSSLILLGAFSAMFCTVGYINAFGVFETYYHQTLLSSKSPSDIAWLGSFNIFVMFGSTMGVGYLNDKYGPRLLLAGGSATMILAMFMTSLCKEYYQLFLAQGLLLGLGISFVILPAFAVIPHHFIRSRGLAMGITVSGSSLGGVVWPIALKNLLYDVGFGWGVRISAFIMLPLLAFACLTIKLPSRMGNQPKGKPDLSVARNPVLLGVAIALFFVYLGLFSPFFYITSWTISRGYDADLGFYMVSITNAASLFGRILPGMLADRIGVFNIMVLSAGISGIICACWTEASSIGGIVVLSLAYGFSSGAVIGLQGACAAKVAQPHQYGVAMGVVMTILSIAGLIGSPINGQLLDAFGYLGISLFSGLAMLVGMLIIILAKLKMNPKIFGMV